MKPPEKKLRPGLFLDRDGVINVEVGYLNRPEDCILMDGIAALLRTAHALGYFVCVVTNQAGIGRGLYTEDDFHSLMDHIVRELQKYDARLDAVYFSPYHPVHGVGAYKRESDCRKPGPGMLFQAAAEHGIDLSQSVLIGDRCSDLQAGHAAGVPRLFLFSTSDDAPCPFAFPYRQVHALSSIEEDLIATTGMSWGYN